MAQNIGDNVTLHMLGAFGNEFFDVYKGSVTRNFTSNHLIANQRLEITEAIYLWQESYPSIFLDIILESPIIILDNCNVSIKENPSSSLTFNNASVTFDNVNYLGNGIGPIGFTGTSSINITSNTNGKTIIKATTLTGTVTLDVAEGVQEGDTFLIEATDNQLVITDGEWIATPSTSGNITTYTLSKATLQKPKFRLLYTVG